MKNIIHISSLFIALFLVTCEEESTGPVLDVTPQTITLSIDNSEVYLNINNPSGSALLWEIRSKPDWLVISDLSGQIYSDKDSILITIDFEDTEMGEYDGNINIYSNMGTATVHVSLILDVSISIFPGDGAAKLELGDRYKDIKDLYGNYDHIWGANYYYPSDGHYEYSYFLDYYSIKAEFIVHSLNEGLSDNYKIISIEVEAPYEGLTKELIGVGSTLAEVKEAYGNPEIVIGDYSRYYKYSSMNTLFYYEEGGTTVSSIRIYNPDNFSGI